MTHTAFTAGYPSAAWQPSTVRHARLCAGHCGAGGQRSTGRSGAAAASDALATPGRNPAGQPLNASQHSHTRYQCSLQGELVQQPGAVVQAQQPGSSHRAGSALLVAFHALQLPQQTQTPVSDDGRWQTLACKSMASVASMVVHTWEVCDDIAYPHRCPSRVKE